MPSGEDRFRSTVFFKAPRHRTTSAIVIHHPAAWLCGVVVERLISDREVAISIPDCSAARCNSGQVVHTRVPLFTKQYKLVPASAGGKVHHRSGVG